MIYTKKIRVMENESKKFSFSTLLQWIFYIVGIVLIVMSIMKYGEDLSRHRGEYRFSEHSYVGGDAYNYIISASRSTTVMVKSLVLAVLGCSSFISGLLLRISDKNNN